MSIRTGNFFVNNNLDIRTLQLPIDQYRHMRRKSILIALTWLEAHVLNQKDVGHHLRERIDRGVSFNDETHKYLMNSCLHWKPTFSPKTRIFSEKVDKLGRSENFRHLPSHPPRSPRCSLPPRSGRSPLDSSNFPPPRSLRVSSSPGGFESEKPLSCPGIIKETNFLNLSLNEGEETGYSSRNKNPIDRSPKINISETSHIKVYPVSILPHSSTKKRDEKKHRRKHKEKDRHHRRKDDHPRLIKNKPKVAPIQPLNIPNTGIYRKRRGGNY